MYTLEVARVADAEICGKIIEAGRKFQNEQGFVQWTEDYPNLETVKSDIKIQKGYVLKCDGVIAGYMFIDFDGDDSYNNIQGKWNTDEPYAVVHRMAFSPEFRGKGLSQIAFGLIEELCISRNVRSIRIDTDFPNKRMQHILKKNGFVQCGEIMFQGAAKLAFDKSF